MQRREFITLIGGAAATWPLASRAQQPERMRRIGVLMSLAADDRQGQARLAAFVQGLRELGWTDGRNVQLDYRWGAGRMFTQSVQNKLIDGGNEYIAAISALDDSNVKVFIRETFQHANQTGKLSFPPTVTESFRPYVKERLVRNDADDEPFFEDGEETEDWSPGATDADDDADEETGLIDIGSRTGAAPGIDLDDENEE